MKKLVFLFAILLISSLSAFSQNNTSVGLRFGSHVSGLSIRHLPGEHIGLEGILSLRYRGGAMVTILLEHQYNDTWGVDGLNWYWGYGAHVGTWSDNDNWKYDGSFTLGADGILGLEYVTKELPLVFSLDYHPFVNLIGPGFVHGGTAFSIRYIL